MGTFWKATHAKASSNEGKGLHKTASLALGRKKGQLTFVFGRSLIGQTAPVILSGDVILGVEQIFALEVIETDVMCQPVTRQQKHNQETNKKSHMVKYVSPLIYQKKKWQKNIKKNDWQQAIDIGVSYTLEDSSSCCS